MAKITIESNVNILFDRSNGANGRLNHSPEQLRFESASPRQREWRVREPRANEAIFASPQIKPAELVSPLPEAPNENLPAARAAQSNALQKAGPAAFYTGQRLAGREIESLWNEILLLRRQHKAQVIGFTGAQSGEGTSTILANLALAIRDFQWPVLLVDLNLAHPHLAKLFSCEPAPGFMDLLEKRCKFPAASRAIIANKLYLLPLGNNKSAGGLNWEITARALYMLKEYFGLILVDLPAIGENPHALHLTCATDGIIQVVRAETTRLESLKAVKQQLERLNVRLFGTVLNRRQFHIPGFLYKHF